MTGKDETLAALTAMGQAADDAIDLAEGALALAALGRPRVPLERYRAHLSELAAGVAPDATDAPAKAEAIAEVLFRRHGYAGDTETYDDLQNANLIRVIDRKRGLPVALSILYIHAGRARGWQVDGLNFPGHFLVRVADKDRAVICDPFHGGQVRSMGELREMLRAMAGSDAELSLEHFQPMANREVLLRLQNNIKLRQLQGGAHAAALGTLDAMLALAPNKAELWRESGLIHARQGHLGAAKAALERFLALDHGHAERHHIAAVLQDIKGRLN